MAPFGLRAKGPPIFGPGHFTSAEPGQNGPTGPQGPLKNRPGPKRAGPRPDPSLFQTFDISVYIMIHPIALWSSACPLWSYSQNCSSSSRNTSINPFLWCVRKYARSNCIKKSITFNFPKHIWGPLIALDRRGALYGVSYRVGSGGTFSNISEDKMRYFETFSLWDKNYQKNWTENFAKKYDFQ